MNNDSQQGFATRAIHAGAEPDPSTGARGTPIYQSTAFVFNDADHAAALFGLEQAGFIYSRLTNPTVSVLQSRMASLEGGVGATCTASGHSAQLLALFALMSSGDEFVASNKLYGGSITQFGHSFKRFGWKVTFVDPIDPENFRSAITAKTRAVFTESLANPGGSFVISKPLQRLPMMPGYPVSSITHCLPPHCVVRLNLVRTSSCIPPQNLFPVMAMPWGVQLWTAAILTGHKMINSRH